MEHLEDMVEWDRDAGEEMCMVLFSFLVLVQEWMENKIAKASWI